MIYLIRHAQSEFNLAWEQSQIPNQGWHEVEEVKFSQDYIDCGITEKGYQQCKKARENIKDIKIDIVLCSPLKRAIITAQEIFGKDKQIQIHENLFEVVASSCDLSNIRNIRQLYKSNVNNGNILFPKLEELDDQWQLNYLQNKVLVQKIEDRIKNGDNFFNAALKEIKDQFNATTNIESNQYLIERIKIFIESLKQIQQNNPGQNIALVGHSHFFYLMTSKYLDENFTPTDTTYLENCEIREYQIN